MVVIRTSDPKVIPHLRAPLCAQCRTPMQLAPVDRNRSTPLAGAWSFKCESCGLSDLLTPKGKPVARSGKASA